MRHTVIVVAVSATLLAGCANSTQMVANWRDPNSQIVLRKTLAVYMSTEPGMRRMVEDKLAARLPGGTPSYRIIPDEQVTNVDVLRRQLARGGYDGIVVMRFVGVTTETTVVNGNPDIYGYWRYWGYAGDPIVYQTDRLYSLESSLYSYRDGRLIWMGRSQTINSKNANKLADYSVNFVVKNLERAGFIP